MGSARLARWDINSSMLGAALWWAGTFGTGLETGGRSQSNQWSNNADT